MDRTSDGDADAVGDAVAVRAAKPAPPARSRSSSDLAGHRLSADAARRKREDAEHVSVDDSPLPPLFISEVKVPRGSVNEIGFYEDEVAKYYKQHGIEPQGPNKAKIAEIDVLIARVNRHRDKLMIAYEDLLASRPAEHDRRSGEDWRRSQTATADRADEELCIANDYLTFLRAKRRLLLPRSTVEIHDPKFRTMFQRMDANGDGCVSYTELLRYFDSAPATEASDFRRSLAIQAFRRIDYDDRGRLRGVAEFSDFFTEFHRMLVISLNEHFVTLASKRPRADGSSDRRNASSGASNKPSDDSDDARDDARAVAAAKKAKHSSAKSSKKPAKPAKSSTTTSKKAGKTTGKKTSSTSSKKAKKAAK